MPAYQRDVALAQEWEVHCGPPLCTRVVLRWRVREHFYEWSSSEEATAISGTCLADLEREPFFQI